MGGVGACLTEAMGLRRAKAGGAAELEPPQGARQHEGQGSVSVPGQAGLALVSIAVAGLKVGTTTVKSVRSAGLQVGKDTRMGTSSDAFEYAIKKDVRNNPIVREVDERRLQEQWRSVAVGVLFVGVLLFSGWQRVELLQHGYRVEQMQKERGDEEEINRHLRLEIETLKAPQRIEKMAIDDLKLVAPETGAAIVIERVVPPEPPATSVVAKALE